MRPFPKRRVTLQDLQLPKNYDSSHDDRRRRIVELKLRRKVELGECLTVVFENYETVLFHLQEIVRLGRLADPVRLQTEVDLYNELQPRSGELTATIFLEAARGQLSFLQGIEKCLYLRGGGRTLARSERIETFVPADSERPGEPSAVYFVRFPLGQGRFPTEGPFTLAVEHPGFTRARVLPEGLAAELRADSE